MSTWNIDPHHSEVLFSIRHLGISTVRGKFTKFSGSAEYEIGNPDSLKLTATIDAASVDTANEQRDGHLKSADFFDVAQFPEITFVAKSASAAGADHLKLVGDLTIHGVTKEVSFDVEGPHGPVTDPYGNTKLGASATGSVNRKDFGLAFHAVLDNGSLLLADEVKFSLEIQLAQA